MLGEFLVDNRLTRGAGADDSAAPVTLSTTSPMSAPNPAATPNGAPIASSPDTTAASLPGQRRTALAQRNARRWRRLLTVAAVVLVAVGLTWATLQRGRLTRARSSPRQSLAIFGFRNISGEAKNAWLSTGLKEMLGTELRASKTLRTLSATEVTRSALELGLNHAAPMSQEALARVQKDLQVDLVLLGSYTLADAGAAGTQLRLDLKVQDCASGAVVAAVDERGDEAELFELVATAGQRLRALLAPHERVVASAAVVRAALPTTVDAARLYAEGLARLRAGDAMGARDQLAAAVAADGEHALSRLALAQAWSTLGYDLRAQDEAKRALALAGPLAREQRLAIEAFAASVGYDWPGTTQSYQRLFDFDPENVEYGLALANAEIHGGHVDAALQTLAALAKRSGASLADPRIDIVRAQALAAGGQLQAAADTAERAAVMARARGADLLVAQAEGQVAHAYARRGQCNRVRSIEVDAKPRFARAHDGLAIAQLESELAHCLRSQGDEVGALQLSEDILRACQELGARRCQALAHQNSGASLQALGRRQEAREHYERAIALDREIADLPALSHTLIDVALYHLYNGDGLQARRQGAEAIAILKQTPARLYLCQAERSYAFILEELGDLDASLRTADASAALAREMGNQHVLADLAQISGRTLLHKGQIAAARASLAEAQRLYTALADRFQQAFIPSQVALIDLEEGDLKAAEQHTRAAIAGLGQLAPDEVRSDMPAMYGNLAWVLLRQGRVAEARAEVDRALALHVDQPFAERAVLTITEARVLAAEKRREAALALLARLRAEAERGDFLPVALRARGTALELRAAAQAPRRPDVALRRQARALAGEAARLGEALVVKQMEMLGRGG
jgi:tetratricopeptide (TPR) repeat protein